MDDNFVRFILRFVKFLKESEHQHIYLNYDIYNKHYEYKSRLRGDDNLPHARVNYELPYTQLHNDLTFS